MFFPLIFVGFKVFAQQGKKNILCIQKIISEITDII